MPRHARRTPGRNSWNFLVNRAILDDPAWHKSALRRRNTDVRRSAHRAGRTPFAPRQRGASVAPSETAADAHSAAYGAIRLLDESRDSRF